MSDDKGWTTPPRVLAVDDEPVVCESIRRVLVEEGYAVETSTSPRAALDLLKEKHFDLLLLDIKMPEMDGIEVLRAARELSPDTEVLIITGYATIDTAVEAIKLGAFDYLEKPVSPPQLLVATARALERRRLVELTLRLRAELESRHGTGRVVRSSPAMRRVMSLVSRVAPTDSTVLITGETGTGKDVIARTIHYNSRRREGPFVVADCASMTETLLESELFGHVRGAFTGAVKDRKGLAETARRGTLFLDEISGLSPRLQGNLLRLLQEKEVRPVGSDKPVPIDARIVAATNRELRELVAEGSFREDLFYRLSVFTIELPPLRERREDLPLLTHHFAKEYSQEFGKQIDVISPRVMAVLEAYDWPGNVRELEHTLERAVLLSDGGAIELGDLPELGANRADEWAEIPQDAEALNAVRQKLRERAVDRVERLFLLKALRASGWNVSEAARNVGMARPNLHALMRKHGVRGPASGQEAFGEVEGSA
jgi:DNA-binding NtrC family response regulator